MDDKLRNNLCENLMTENNNNFFFLIVLYVCRRVAHVKYKYNRSSRSLFEKFMR